jgi:hypothetical protein
LDRVVPGKSTKIDLEKKGSEFSEKVRKTLKRKEKMLRRLLARPATALRALATTTPVSKRALSTVPAPGSEAAWALQMQACEEEAERIFQELNEGYDDTITPTRPVNPQNPPRKKPIVDAQGRIYSTGRRKTSSARVWIMPGTV